MELDNILRKIDANKKKIAERRPLKPAEIGELDRYFKIGITYSSNALEGNTLTLSETKILIEDGLTVAGRPMRDCYEAMGHSEAYDYMISVARSKTLALTQEVIKKIHLLFYKRLDDQAAGIYRNYQVFISGTEYIPPQAEKVPSLMEQFIDELEQLWEDETHPVLVAAYAHKRLVDIHPFADGNGRTARLLMNLILINKGYCIASIPPVMRREYIEALQIAQREKNSSIEPFYKLIAECEMEAQRDYFRMFHIR